jgi:putative effector of murein hydrolase
LGGVPFLLTIQIIKLLRDTSVSFFHYMSNEAWLNTFLPVIFK